MSSDSINGNQQKGGGMSEISRDELLRELESQAKTISWYSKRFKEQLTIHHRRKQDVDALREELELVLKNHAKLEKHYRAMEMECKHGLDRERLLGAHYRCLEEECKKLRGSSILGLPFFLRWPLKALILAFSLSPLQVLKSFRSKLKSKKPVREWEAEPKIEVVTLAYNSEKFIEGYFKSFRQLRYPLNKIRINILDNCSPDNSYEVIQRDYVNNPDYPIEVRLLKSEQNLGFTGGNNLVLKQLLNEKEAPGILLLNFDTEIQPDCITELVRFMRNDNAVGMVEARQDPKEHPKWYDPTTFETGWCSGGGVLIAREALEETGLFDDRFFLYCEDVDLSWRMWLNGWKCKINPQAVYTHYTEDLNAEKDHSVQQYYSVRNGLFMRQKYDSSQGLREHEECIVKLAETADPKSREVLKRALEDSRKHRMSLHVDRVRYATYHKPHWIMFNQFEFERRRSFRDTPDGRREILN